jgi:hypothetical protein
MAHSVSQRPPISTNAAAKVMSKRRRIASAVTDQLAVGLEEKAHHRTSLISRCLIILGAAFA